MPPKDTSPLTEAFGKWHVALEAYTFHADKLKKLIDAKGPPEDIATLQREVERLKIEQEALYLDAAQKLRNAKQNPDSA